jgi:hypothetical protein
MIVYITYKSSGDYMMRQFDPKNWFFFISEEVTDFDKELFFGPLDGSEKFVIIGPNWNLANILKSAGSFTSLNQAKKNGWNRPIAKGWTDIVIGKLKREISILNM